MQFTSLSNRPPEFFTNEPRPGFGGRVTYNFTDYLAVEAEGNFYPRRTFTFLSRGSTGGYPAQMQFGVKAGRRFRRFGLFGKARPGFVTFSRVAQFVGTRTVEVGSQPVAFPLFEDRRKTYFAMDVGGVLEFYHSRRLFTRFDFGDTIIRYGERRQQSFIPGQAPATLPAENQHNFQFTAGVGLRF